jgi:DNA-binding transcriptional LysR family regulator
MYLVDIRIKKTLQFQTIELTVLQKGTMNMFELSRIPYFVAVAETGSFVRASEKLRITKSAMTTQIQKLESELTVQLFLRTTRQVKLTHEGSNFLVHCRSILNQCETAQTELIGQQKEISGSIRLTATSDTGPLIIAPILAEFSKSYPNIELELLVSDDNLDLVSNQLDIAIREGELKPSSAQAERLHDFEQWVVCGSKYTSAIKAKNSIELLKSLRWATVSKVQSSQVWNFTLLTGKRKRMNIVSSFQSNNTLAVLKWVENCPGCAVLPDFLVKSHIEGGRIKRLLTDMKLPNYKVHALYLDSHLLPERTRLLLDFIKLHLAR